MSALLELAERCEAATAEQQDKLLMDAWYEVFGHGSPTGGHKEWMERREALVRMLNVKAYESAALTLVPEEWRIDGMRDHIIPKPYTAVGIVCWSDRAHGKAVTRALAICAAALRARAA